MLSSLRRPPATLSGKLLAGVADDLLSTTIMAAGKPVLICPAMNNKMLTNPIVQDNLGKLQEHGYFIMGKRRGRTGM